MSKALCWVAGAPRCLIEDTHWQTPRKNSSRSCRDFLNPCFKRFPSCHQSPHPASSSHIPPLQQHPAVSWRHLCYQRFAWHARYALVYFLHPAATNSKVCQNSTSTWAAAQHAGPTVKPRNKNYKNKKDRKQDTRISTNSLHIVLLCKLYRGFLLDNQLCYSSQKKLEHKALSRTSELNSWPVQIDWEFSIHPILQYVSLMTFGLKFSLWFDHFWSAKNNHLANGSA